MPAMITQVTLKVFTQMSSSGHVMDMLDKPHPQAPMWLEVVEWAPVVLCGEWKVGRNSLTPQLLLFFLHKVLVGPLLHINI